MKVSQQHIHHVEVVAGRNKDARIARTATSSPLAAALSSARKLVVPTAITRPA